MSTIAITDEGFGILPDSTALHDLERAGHTISYRGVPANEEEMIAAVHDAEAIILGPGRITRAVIEASPRLRIIARYGAGLDDVDIAAARERGIHVTNARGANGDSVAEYAVMLMLMLSRRPAEAIGYLASGIWKQVRGRELKHRTLGVVGTGYIGQQVIRIAKGFAMQVIAYDVNPSEQLTASGAATYVTLEELAERSDIVTLHVPLLPSTERLVDGDFLARMRPGALLINTSRGRVIDGSALHRALSSGHIGGAALDVFEVEPPFDDPLLQLPNLIATPHTSSCTDDAMRNLDASCVESVLTALRGERPALAV